MKSTAADMVSSAAEHGPRRKEGQTPSQANPRMGRGTAQKLAGLAWEADAVEALLEYLSGPWGLQATRHSEKGQAARAAVRAEG